jgi:multidrug efflux pump
VQKILPPGVALEKAYDSSIFIERSLADVRETIVESILMVVIVIWLFLRTFRATIIPTVAIPVSVIGTFWVLDLLGYSINTLTLMGLTLAIGLVVDDAIIVLENITRWIEDGTPPMEAARRGMDEIGFAVIAATISTLAVFLPLAFLGDKTGGCSASSASPSRPPSASRGSSRSRCRRRSAPASCAPPGEERGMKRALARGFEAIEHGYARLLRPALAHRTAAVVLGGAWVVLGVILIGRISREFIPTADRGIIQTFSRAPEGSTMAYTDRYPAHGRGDHARHAGGREELLGGGARSRHARAGHRGRDVHDAPTRGRSARGRSRASSTSCAAGSARSPGITVFPINPPALAQGQGNPLSLVIQGPDVTRLAHYADEIVQRGRQVPGVVNLQSDLIINKPQLEVTIDRDRASDLGVSVREGRIDAPDPDRRRRRLALQARRRDLRRDRAPRARAALASRTTVSPLRARSGWAAHPLASVVRARESVSPRGLPHFDRLRASTISGSLAGGAPLGSALAQMRAIAEEVLPDGQGYHVTFSGESEDFFTSGQAPRLRIRPRDRHRVLDVGGAVRQLPPPGDDHGGGGPVVHRRAGHARADRQLPQPLQPDRARHARRPGDQELDPDRRVRQPAARAGPERGRGRRRGLAEALPADPHDRGSTIVGILPIALGLGAGGEARAPLGIAVAGGMLFSTILTFLVVPRSVRGARRPARALAPFARAIVCERRRQGGVMPFFPYAELRIA